MIKKKKFGVLMVGLIMFAVAIAFLVPIYYLVINAFKTLPEVVLDTGAFPKSLYLKNFTYMWTKTGYPTLFKNSVVIGVCSMAGIILFGSMAGYKLSRINNKWSKLTTFYFISTLIIPFQATMIPLIKLLRDMNLIDSIFGLIMVYIGMGTPFAIFLYSAAAKSIPISLEEAAKIDGAGRFTTFFKVIFPLMGPVTVTVLILDGLWIWNDFLLPLITLTTPAHKTVPIGTVSLIIGTYGQAYNYGVTVALLGCLPMIILYLFLQKYIVKGIVDGATKG